MCKLGCMLSQAPTLWIRSGEISLTEKFINYCEEKSVTQITNSCVCVCVCVCVCARARARVCVCVCVCVLCLFTTCSITKQYYMFKCSFDSLAVLLISS